MSRKSISMCDRTTLTGLLAGTLYYWISLEVDSKVSYGKKILISDHLSAKSGFAVAMALRRAMPWHS